MGKKKTPAAARPAVATRPKATARPAAAAQPAAAARPATAARPAARAGGSSPREELLAAPPATRPALVLAYLHRQAAQVLELPPARLRVDRSLAAHGLDSLAAAELMGAIETGLGVQVELGCLLEGPTLAQLGEQVLGLLAATAPATVAPEAGGAGVPGGAAAGPGAGVAPGIAEGPPHRYPLSHGQRALWLLDRLVPGGNPAYVIAGAARIRGHAGPGAKPLDVQRLRRALAALVERHPALRTTFEQDGEDAVQVVRDAATFDFSEEDARGWSEARLGERLARGRPRPLHPAPGPPLRAPSLS